MVDQRWPRRLSLHAEPADFPALDLLERTATRDSEAMDRNAVFVNLQIDR